MSIIKNESYFVTHGWMRIVLNLDKTELSVFAIIYGFSQSEGSRFNGSIQYLSEFTGSCRSSIHTALQNLRDKNYIHKYIITNKYGEFIEYGCNLEYINELLTNYKLNNIERETITNLDKFNEEKTLELDVQKLDMPVQKLDTPVQKLDTDIQKLDSDVQKLDSSVQKLHTINNINNINKIEDNKNIYLRDSHSDFFPKNSSLENSTNTKNKKSTLNFSSVSEDALVETLKQTIERGGENGSVSLSELVGEKLADIDNRQAQQARLLKQQKRQNEPTMEEKQNMRIKKARMKEAQQRTSDPELLSALSDFIESYQFTHNKLSPQAWKLILDELFGFGESTEKMIKYINNSIASGYRKIYKCNTPKSRDFDNTRGRNVEKALHEFTEEERKAFDDSLAKDENGNFIVF